METSSLTEESSVKSAAPFTPTPFATATPVTPPVPVSVVGPVSVLPPGVTPQISAPAKVGDKNIAPTTTEAQDKEKAGQVRVNLIWELVQAGIAVAVVSVTLYVAARLALQSLSETNEKQSTLATTAFMLMASLVSLIIGFYFGRTDLQKLGHTRETKE